jgi:lipoyl(octanoyl) transferase
MISLIHLGSIDYGTAQELQKSLVELRKAGRIDDVLLLLEHTPVITLGRNAKDNNIVVPRELLATKGVELFECDRGGDVTFHGPGQLVAYPIFDLRALPEKIGAVEFVRRLEEVLILTNAFYGIPTQRIKGMTGVWTYAEPPVKLKGPGSKGEQQVPRSAQDDKKKSQIESQERKIAAIGVHISRAVTSHGFALNVTTDLDYFKLIVPCGLTKPVTSIEYETGNQVSMEELMPIVSRHFGQVFKSQVLWLEDLNDLLPGIDVGAPQDTPMQKPKELRELHGDDISLA